MITNEKKLGILEVRTSSVHQSFFKKILKQPKGDILTGEILTASS